MKKKMIFTALVLAGVFGGVFGWYALRQHFIKQYFATYVPDPQVISAITAQSVQWTPYLTAIGTLNAVNGVEISAEVSGQVREIFFRSGEVVRAGQPLIQLDNANEAAQLKDIEAQLKLATINDERTRTLFEKGAVSRSAVDDSEARVKQLLANQENVRALMNKKLIRAPFSGKIGIKQVNVGQFVSPGYSCASLQSFKTLNAVFSLPQQEVGNIARGRAVKVTTDALPGLTFQGTIDAIDSRVDNSTRTIEIQASIDNHADKLLPGMFVNVQVSLPSLPNTIVVPQTAITYTLYGDSAFIVTPNGEKDSQGRTLGTVKQVAVRTGEKRDHLVVIQEGILPGQLVVDSGQLKLTDGITVAINNSIQL